MQWIHILVGLFLGANALAQAKKPQDIEETWKLLQAYNPNVIPAIEVPPYPEYSTWRITGTVAGKEVHQQQVPVWHLEPDTQIAFVVGSIPIGTEFALNQFALKKNAIFYAVDPELVNFDGARTSKLTFVSGFYVERHPDKSFKPPKEFDPKWGMRTRHKPRKIK